MIASVARSSDNPSLRNIEDHDPRIVEKVLDLDFQARNRLIGANLGLPLIPFTQSHAGKPATDAGKKKDPWIQEWFSPGGSLRSLCEEIQLMTLKAPTSTAADKSGEAVVDSYEILAPIGSHAADPGKRFKRFEIHVSHSRYTVKLFGYTKDNEAELLFQCKAGLGSREYPTPRGSYLLLWIYDKRPLWIPPRDREWAYGMKPSHSVYGGHMMPFFVKKPLDGRKAKLLPDQGMDRVAAKMKIIDGGAYRIHGTDSPWSVGQNQSHGCVRLRNRDVKRLSNTLKEYVGVTTRDRSANGEYVRLKRPVRLTLF
jgi:hypothetical protein